MYDAQGNLVCAEAFAHRGSHARADAIAAEDVCAPAKSEPGTCFPACTFSTVPVAYEAGFMSENPLFEKRY